MSDVLAKNLRRQTGAFVAARKAEMPLPDPGSARPRERRAGRAAFCKTCARVGRKEAGALCPDLRDQESLAFQ